MRRVIPPLLLLVASALAGGHIPKGDGAPSDPASEHRRIVEHWTSDRQASAVDRDVVLESAGGQARSSSSPQNGPLSTPWSGDGPVTLTTGRVFFTEGRFSYSCSGSAVHSDRGSLVLTAGHCVHGGGARETFVTDWIFYPGWTGPSATPPLGAWTATDLFTTSAWSTAGSFDDDAGFAVVVGDAGRGTLEQELASQSAAAPVIAFEPAPAAGDPITALGYPAAKRATGNVLTTCTGNLELGLDGNHTVATRCDMSAGSSGGPWFGTLTNAPGDTGTIRSLTSYGYSSLKGYLFGPIFDGGEQSAYQAASTVGDCAGAVSGAFACVDVAA